VSPVRYELGFYISEDGMIRLLCGLNVSGVAVNRHDTIGRQDEVKALNKGVQVFGSLHFFYFHSSALRHGPVTSVDNWGSLNFGKVTHIVRKKPACLPVDSYNAKLSRQ
jgi:hypothetical protein